MRLFYTWFTKQKQRLFSCPTSSIVAYHTGVVNPIFASYIEKKTPGCRCFFLVTCISSDMLVDGKLVNCI